MNPRPLPAPPDAVRFGPPADVDGPRDRKELFVQLLGQHQRRLFLYVMTLVPCWNDAEEIIGFQEPYAVTVEITGTCPILFHRWSVESVEAKANAAKGSKAKKTGKTRQG